MGLNLQMLTRDGFIPEHQENYVAFIVDDFYGYVEFKTLQCEFHYSMVGAEDGIELTCGACYYKDDLPFNTPLLFDGETPYLLSEDKIKERKNHKDDRQRFWWIKTWFLHSGNFQIHPYELDEISIGIMKESDFTKQVRIANEPRLLEKQKNRGE